MAWKSQEKARAGFVQGDAVDSKLVNDFSNLDKESSVPQRPGGVNNVWSLD